MSPRRKARGAVRTGLDEILVRPAPVKGLRLGLVANPTSVTGSLVHAALALRAARGVRLAALFGPEHGIWADAQDLVEVEDSRDPMTGLPVFSLYGRTRAPTAAMLERVDALVYDVQDVGSRYYTFIYTMLHAMEACAQHGKVMVVLDRPNPLGGEDLDGNLLDPQYLSFVGMHPLLVRHGMTAGELARMFAAERHLDLDLRVVRMKGWRRGMHFEDTGLPWVLPSPNMPTVDTAFVYPGGCLVEGTNLSEGRGTTRPFELVGAPWIDPWRLAKDLAKERLPGVVFRPDLLHADLPEARGPALRGRAAPRDGPRAVLLLAHLPPPRPPRAGPGPRPLQLARPSLRVRAREAAHRHPVRDGPGTPGHGERHLAARLLRRLGPRTGGLPSPPRPLPALLKSAC